MDSFMLQPRLKICQFGEKRTIQGGGTKNGELAKLVTRLMVRAV
jgi:hypothetical protein